MTSSTAAPRDDRAVRSADGTTLAVRVYGPDDAPTVVLAHGWSCNAEFWTPQIQALAGDLRIVAYDQRGHGASAAPDHKSGYSTDALAADLAAVLDGCAPAGRKVVLVGHSMGGFTALAFAGRYPDRLADRVAAVLLVSTAAGELVPNTRLLPGAGRSGRARNAVGRAFLGSTLPTGPSSALSRRVLRFIGLSPRATPAQLAFAESIVRTCPRRTRGWCGAFIAQLDLRDDVARLTVPAVVVVGADDRLTPPGQSRRLAAQLPNLIELVELPDVGHMAPIEAPDVITSLIRRLVAEYL